jgi:Skp family chaperone for outer membrane proteins
MRVLAAAAIAALALFASPEARSQDVAPGQILASPVLTLDQERLFAESQWGKRAVADLDARSQALAAENRKIEGDLTAEEKALTERRPGMEPAAFRAEADAFDAKVVEIRATQDGKVRDLNRLREAERQAFFQAAFPILGEVMRDRGAVAILDNRAIFVASNSIDVTDEMIRRIDAAVGAGKAPELPPLPEEGGGSD